MIQKIGFSQFCDAFSDTYKNSFSYDGKRALFDYLEEYEDSTGENVELDTVALCCDYTEYDSFEELQKNYTNIKDMEDLENHTTVIVINDHLGNFIIQNF